MTRRRGSQSNNPQRILSPRRPLLPPLDPINSTSFLCCTIEGPPSEYFVSHATVTLFFWATFRFGMWYYGPAHFLWLQGVAVDLPLWVPPFNISMFAAFIVYASPLMLKFALFQAVFVTLLNIFYVGKFFHDSFYTQSDAPSITGLANLTTALVYLICVPLTQLLLIPQYMLEMRRNEEQAQRDLQNQLR
ncbi:unnamed protein product [Caenorhabditis sp. 36 PRJEB53466]|nr:unnamed protein product [Caenorhabditis sp. 36 PRJEB53466]